MVWVFIGPPGSGKDTQAQLAAEKLNNYTVVSTGQALREEIAAGTEIGKKVAAAYAKGELMSDDDMYEVLLSRMKRLEGEDFIYTGYPRTVSQVNHLDDLLTQLDLGIDGVIYFRLPDEVVVERISGRLYAPKAQRYYHEKYNPPKVEGIDDETGEPLVRREDDHPESVRQRLAIYHKETAPVLEKLRAEKASNFYEIDASGPIDTVKQSVLEILA